MAEPNYSELGFKCGIEIHQQLDTHKLFCSCPSIIRDEEPDIFTKRKMRAVAGEVGGVDPATLYEFLRNREMIYQAYSDTTCLVELDEEPPHQLNEEALDIALEISTLLDAKPVDELHVMRKTVIDGSNTSGFQRTILVAMEGHIDTEEGRIDIPLICLEEDASRKIEEKENKITYRLDRLGIPLIEICTNPDIKNPEHARTVAEKLGRILRATGKVKRGLGTIRQDLNVSIRGGERIEIKGVQDLRIIKDIVKNEVNRQLMLIEVKNELERRAVKEKDLETEFIDVTSIFKNTKSGLVSDMLKRRSKVIAVRLTGMKGLLKGKLGPELAQYAKASAGVKGIFHSDELPGYGIDKDEVKSVNDFLGVKKDDAFALVVEEKNIAKNALTEIINRCKIALQGVPEETRKAKQEGGTEFMRPLPGSARMYPETDEPPLIITDNRMNKIVKNLPELPEEKIERSLEMGLGKELSNQLVKSRWSFAFDGLADKFPEIKKSLIATTILSTPKEVKKKYGVDTNNLEERHYMDIFKEISEGRITKGVIPEIIAGLAEEPVKSAEEVVKEKQLQSLTQEDVEKITDEIIKENADTIEAMGRKALGVLLGKAMAKINGRADASQIREIIQRRIG